MLQSVNLPFSDKYRICMVGRRAVLSLKQLFLLLIMGLNLYSMQATPQGSRQSGMFKAE